MMYLLLFSRSVKGIGVLIYYKVALTIMKYYQNLIA